MTAKFDINVVQEKEKKKIEEKKGPNSASLQEQPKHLMLLRSWVCVFAHLSKNHMRIRDDLIVGAFVRK